MSELEGQEFGRIQSPSSINTFKQCPRKYFYRYIKRLPTKPSIHLIRGSIVHKVLEDIYDIPVEKIPKESFPSTLKIVLQEKFKQEWEASKHELATLGLDAFDLEQYYEETKIMINNFFHYLFEQLEEHPDDYHVAFRMLTPQREVELVSNNNGIRGFADAIHERREGTMVLDYKTSKKCEITPEYMLQLSIYGLLLEEYDKRPDEVGIFFLKHGQELKIKVTDEMVTRAREEIWQIHKLTMSKNIEDYPKSPSPLCKWSSGQCDYYDLCFGTRTLDHYTDLVQLGK